MTPEDDHFPRLACPAPNATRYEYIRRTNTNRDLKYFFALDLHRRAKILPQLIGSIVETVRFLGLEKCALSIVKASWDDGTSIILKLLREDLERIGVMYFVNSSDIVQRVSEPLAMHRSLELGSLVKHPDRFSTKVTMNMAFEPLMKNPE
jgi:alpha-1,3-mannosyltransferase